MSQFLTYSKFHTRQEAAELTQLLDNAGIPFQVDLDTTLLDKIYIGENLDPSVAVRIPSNQFEAVNTLLKAEAETQIQHAHPDHYLFDFSDQELIEVVQQPTEWNHFDLALATKILTDRNVRVPSMPVQDMKAPAAYPLRLELQWIIMGYVLSLIFAWAGIIAGMITIIASRALPTGEKVKMYDAYTHNHATIMIVIGVLRTLYFLFQVMVNQGL